MSEAKSMRKLDKHLARSHKALHDALELFRLLNSIRGRGDMDADESKEAA